jgi:hypothetical protein
MSDTIERVRSRRAAALRHGSKALMVGVAGLDLMSASVGGNLIVPDHALAAAASAASENLAAPPSFADIIQRVTPASTVERARLRIQIGDRAPFSYGMTNDKVFYSVEAPSRKAGGLDPGRTAAAVSHGFHRQRIPVTRRGLRPSRGGRPAANRLTIRLMTAAA